MERRLIRGKFGFGHPKKPVAAIPPGWREQFDMARSVVKTAGTANPKAFEAMKAAESLLGMISPCRLCPRLCGARRLDGEKGACGFDWAPVLASDVIHTGEEPPISGTAPWEGTVIPLNRPSSGSGTLFFSGCAMKCVFCQNYPISQMNVGTRVTIEELALKMLRLEAMGAFNINMVTGSHFLHAAAAAAAIAIARGLSIPILHNFSGYEFPKVLEIASDFIDIFLPDCKYSDPILAGTCSDTFDYVPVNRECLDYLAGSSGPLALDDRGLAASGTLVRHLVIPGHAENTRGCLKFLDTLRPRLPVSVMFQYFQARPGKGPEGRISENDCDAVLSMIEEMDEFEGFVQDPPWEN